MIIGKKWNDMLANIPTQDYFTNIDDTLEEIDTLVNDKGISINSVLSSLFTCVKNDYLTVDTNLWKDLPIYLSSYKLNDKRVWYVLKQKLIEYCGFYKKLLTDDGVSRRIATHHSFDTDRDNTSDTKNIDSNTPNYTGLFDSETETITNAKFEEAIANFASDMSHAKGVGHQDDSGESDTVITGYSWTEAEKNIRYVYFNELVDFIARIPEMIYDYYSLDTYPTPVLVREYFKNIKASFDLLKYE